VIKGKFHRIEGAKAVGSSGNHSDFVIETLNGAIGDFSFGSKPIQDQRLMGAQHPGHLFHRFVASEDGGLAGVHLQLPKLEFLGRDGRFGLGEGLARLLTLYV
jgi:hypothetical protein